MHRLIHARLAVLRAALAAPLPTRVPALPPAGTRRRLTTRGLFHFLFFSVGDEIGHDLHEGVSIDRNTLLCAPIPLCLMPRRSSAGWNCCNTESTISCGAGFSFNPAAQDRADGYKLRGAKSQVCDRQERRSGT